MARASDWILLTQVHPHILRRREIPRSDLQEALPEEAFDRHVQLTALDVPAPGAVQTVSTVDWADWQRRQGEAIAEQLLPALDRNPDARIAYFGATFIPLAVDLGFHLGTFRRVDVYQHHHMEYHWRWKDTERTLSTTTTGLPSAMLQLQGDAVIRVCTSPYGVSDKSVHACVPDHIADIRIQTSRLELDALASPADLECVVQAFREAVEAILRFRPGAQRVHLFLSGPVGLAFRLGAALPTSAPPVQTYQFDATAQRHRPALVIPPAHTTAQPRSVLLLLAAGPREESALRVNQEHDDLMRRLVGGPFEVVSRLASKRDALQGLLDDTRPTHIHFAGHGDGSGAMLFEDPSGNGAPVAIDDLVELLRLSASGSPFRSLVFNACHSADVAEATVAAQACEYAIGIVGRVDDDAAIAFADGYYRRLLSGDSVPSAFQWGTNQIKLNERIRGEASKFKLFEH